MEQVKSADGIRIAYHRSGRGPALVLVVGAFCDRNSSKTLAAGLSSTFTVYEYDRRGRGDSGDADSYAIDREVDDLDAVVTAAGGSAFVFGHSSGGALALEAAAAGVAVRRLAVHEPPYTGDDHAPAGFADQLAELVRSGRRGEAAARFLALTGIPDQVLAQIKAGPGWAGMQAIAHTLAYDITLTNGGAVPVDRLARISARTLALAGAASPNWATETAKVIAAAVPDAEYRVLDGQGHGVADEVLVPLLVEFFG